MCCSGCCWCGQLCMHLPSSPLVVRPHWSCSTFGTGREAWAALGSCLIFLCLKLAWLDAHRSNAVQRRENQRHSCRVRGSTGSRAVTQHRTSCPADRYWLQQRGCKPKIAPSCTHEINRWEGVRAPRSPCPVLCSAPAEKFSIWKGGVCLPAPQEQGGWGMAGAKVPAWPDPTSPYQRVSAWCGPALGLQYHVHLPSPTTSGACPHHLRQLLLLEGVANKCYATFYLYFLCSTEQNVPIRLAGILLLLYQKPISPLLLPLVFCGGKLSFISSQGKWRPLLIPSPEHWGVQHR